jgi:ArsR family transcriptional regulator
MDATSKKLYEMKAEVIQAAGHPIRLAIIDFLKGGEQCVCDIATHVGAQRSNVSRHLGVMLKAGIVDCRKDGLRMM